LKGEIFSIDSKGKQIGKGKKMLIHPKNIDDHEHHQ
jgi:hypothetical protein